MILKKSLIVSLFTAVLVLVGVGFSLPLALNTAVVEAADAGKNGDAAEEGEKKSGGSADAWAKPIAASICLLGGCIGTAMAQMKIGAAGAGAIAEKPETATMVIVMLAIPETIVILSFVVAAMLIMF